MKILFVGGGSIGHIAPSVAIWEALRELRPGASAHFVCGTRSGEKEFLRKNHLDYTPLNAPRLSIGLPWKFWKAVPASKKILSDVQPDIILSKGGYVSLPLCFAARGKIPIVLHESDSISGRANAIVRRWSVCAIQDFPRNPIRSCITKGSREKGLSIAGLSGDRPVLLVLGGSQGATDINRIIIELLPKLLEQTDIIHITGKGKGVDVQEPGYYSSDFANEELPHFYACANFAVSRAGASAIAELLANSIPTILVPLQGVAHNHQKQNAIVTCSQEDSFVLLHQYELEEKLLPVLSTLTLQSSEALDSDVAGQIAEILLITLDMHHGDQ